MANEIFNESHYFMCEGGLKPASLKTSQENVLLENNKYYLTEYSLKCKGIDFSCRWVALLVAIIAAAIALLMSCPAGWVLLAAIAGAAGGALLAGKICGDKAAIVRVWLVIKDDVVFGEHKAVSNHKPQHLNCRAFGYNIVYKPNVTSEFEAICIFGGNVLMTGLEAFMYVYAFRGGGTLLTKPMTFFRNFGVNYLKTISKYGMLGRGVFGVWGGANAYYMSDTEGFNANEVAKASAQSFFFAETAAYHAVTERDPQSIALLLSMGGIPAGGKTGQRNSLGMEKVADATKADLANSVEGVKNNMRSAVNKAIEFRDKLKSQKKGDGAFEKYLGGRGINSQFGDTMGEYSGREFFKDKCGGKILDLDYKNTTITKEGIETVKEHTSRFGEDHANQKMIERLEAIERGELEITEYDKRYYTHEIRESQRYDNMGVEKGEKGSFEQWNDAHTATLEDYKINEIEQPLYHPEALNE